jgi:hypothetical protein
MKYIEGDLHDPCVASYQTLELARLNEVLIQNGISDQVVRRAICEQYFFDAGQFLDCGWFEEKGRRFHPVVCFEEVLTNGQRKGDMLVPEPGFGTAFHEYAHGAAFWLYEDHAEDASEIETGEINLSIEE